MIIVIYYVYKSKTSAKEVEQLLYNHCLGLSFKNSKKLRTVGRGQWAKNKCHDVRHSRVVRFRPSGKRRLPVFP